MENSSGFLRRSYRFLAGRRQAVMGLALTEHFQVVRYIQLYHDLWRDSGLLWVVGQLYTRRDS